MENNKLKGYLSVEASIIMPVVICVLVLLCYLGFFLHNRCLLEQDACRLGLRGSIVTGLSGKETANYVITQGDNLLSHYYGVSAVNRSSKVSLLEVSVELQANMQVPFAFISWQDEKMNGEWKMQVQREFDRTKPVDFIRACRKVEQLLN